MVALLVQVLAILHVRVNDGLVGAFELDIRADSLGPILTGLIGWLSDFDILVRR